MHTPTKLQQTLATCRIILELQTTTMSLLEDGGTAGPAATGSGSAGEDSFPLSLGVGLDNEISALWKNYSAVPTDFSVRALRLSGRSHYQRPRASVPYTVINESQSRTSSSHFHSLSRLK
ncbi:hypothetical protein SKAU_G00290080 [Synaphobranchus kaupii]|uniref:Uncharacterized protein n=1 Tax=Synaphobranchus kaupii TaxID=118154 RepID=A0A9Q1IK32_SYNKA|nr:hypothetical protein SKAU_G00290080 [Synaphobranchus kaupii]